MGNPLFNMLMGQNQGYSMPAPMPMMQNSPMQRMAMAMQAMQNPAKFVLNAFPDIPAQIQNNPGAILQYLQQTRGITNEQIRQAANQVPWR